MNALIKQILMSTVEIRAELHQLIDQVDERFLKAMHLMVSAYQSENPIIGYEIDGTPVYAKEARKQFDEDLKDRESFMSLEDFKKELEAL